MLRIEGGGEPATRQDRMIERHQGRPLPVRRDIGAAEIIDHIDTGQLRQQRAIADLPGPMPVGPVQDGLAMKTDQRHIDRPQGRLNGLEPALRDTDDVAWHEADVGLQIARLQKIGQVKGI